MNSRKKEIMERMASLNDETLIIIITEDFNEYEDEALRIAKQELESRNINVDDYIAHKRFEYIIEQTDIAVSDLVFFTDIITQTDFNLIEEAIFNLYPDDKEFTEEYKSFYAELLQIKPSECNSVLIAIEKQLEDIDDSKIELWNVYGLDTKTGENLNLELFEWSKWLTFHVNVNDLEKVGRENYIAHCFYRMTINGFNKEDIKTNLEIKVEKSNYNKFLLNAANSSTLDFTDKNVFRAVLEYKKKSSSGEIPQIRPWVRLWARMLDGMMVFLILFVIMKFIVHANISLQILSVPVSPLVVAVIESLLLSAWGTTLGKWIFEVKVRDEEGNKLDFKKAVRRSFMVWLFGEALSFNSILTTFSYMVSYFRLTRAGKTYWDEKCKSIVSHGRIGVLRCVTRVILIIVLWGVILGTLYKK